MGSRKIIGWYIISSPFKIQTYLFISLEKSTSTHTIASPGLVKLVTLSWILSTLPTDEAIECRALGDWRCAHRRGNPSQTGIAGD
jgi:hypothetical protein